MAKTDTTTSSTDVDAKVLQSMLDDNKLDAADVQRVLDHLQRQPSTTPEQQEEESPYASQVLQKLTDTKLFRKLSVQASEWLESTQLRVRNKLEQDLSVVLALTSTIWDRATRSVARALPATMTNTTSTRLLLSAAPAGRRNAARRQQRAFQSAKQQQQQAVPNVVNAAYQVQRELKAETSAPGYKTAPARQAIAAAAVSAYRIAAAPARLLQQQKERESLLLLEDSQTNEDSSDVHSTMDDTESATVEASFFAETDYFAETTTTSRNAAEFVDISDALLLDRLDACIRDPQGTWLTPQVQQVLPHVDYCVQETLSLLQTARDTANNSTNLAQLLVQTCDAASARTSRAVGSELQYYLLKAEESSAVPESIIVEDAEEIMVITDAQVESYNTAVVDDGSSSSSAVVAELITTMDDEMEMNAAQTEVDTKEEENFLATIALRALDVLFLVVEKVVVVGIPATVTVSQTAFDRIQGVQRQGQGTKGWIPVSTVKGRY